MTMKLPKIIENSTLYSITSFLQKGIGFFLIPLYTTYLTPADYGTLNLLSSIMGFLGILFLFSLHGAAGRFNYSVANINERKRLWGTIVIMVLINSVFWGTLCIVLHKYLIDPFTGDISFWNITIISLLCVILNPLYLLFQQWLQINEEGRRFSINMFSNWLLSTVLNIVTVAVFKLGVLGMLFSTLIVNIIFFVISIRSFLPNIDLHFDKRIAKDSVSYAAPLIPHSVSGYLSVMADRVLLNKFASLTQLGLYSIATQFGMILNTITSSINQAYTPWFLKEIAKNEFDNKKMNLFFEVSIVFSLLSTFLIVMYSPDIIKLMTNDAYYMAWQPIIFVCVGYVFNGVYFFFSQPIFYFKPKWVMIISISQLMVNLVLNLLLISRYGYMGAGCAFLCSQFYATVITLILSSKCSGRVIFEWKKVYSLILLIGLISSLVFPIEYNMTGMSKLLVKLIFTASFLIIISIRYFSMFKYLRTLPVH